jgi:mannosidase alpha-like ER degradation enhancer 2
MGDSLLDLAVDLASRMLPAFDTATGIPYGLYPSGAHEQRIIARDTLAGTVNLLHGVPVGETTSSSLAGAGSNLLEFFALSRASGNPIFGAKAAAAMRALVARRSSLGLYGNHIDVNTGLWLLSDSGVGTNSDSFVEYLAKAAFVGVDSGNYGAMFESLYVFLHRPAAKLLCTLTR